MVVVEPASLEPVIQDKQSMISKFLAHEVSTIGSIAVGIALAPPFMAEDIMENYCNSYPSWSNYSNEQNNAAVSSMYVIQAA
jgi:hypothetical protein